MGAVCRRRGDRMEMHFNPPVTRCLEDAAQLSDMVSYLGK